MFRPKRDSADQDIATTGTEALLLKIAVYAVGFVGSIVVSRVLGPAGRGTYYLPVVAASTAVSLAKLGLQNANVYLFAERKVSVERITGQNGLFALVMGAIAAVALLQGPWALPSVFGQTPLVLLVLAAVTIPFSMHQQYSAGLLNLIGVVTWQFRASLISGVGQLVALVALAVSGHLDPFSVLAVNLVTIVTTWGLTQRGFARRSSHSVRLDVGLLRETLSNSLVMHVAMVLYFLHLRLDTFMVQAIAGPAALGQYSVAVTLAETMLLASDSLGVAVLPRLVSDNLRESALMSLRASRMNVLVSVILGVGWAVVGYVVIGLFYGASFTPAFFPLLALLPGMTALGLQRCTGGPVLRTGQRWKFAGIYGVSVLFNIGLNLVLIPSVGITGAALASSLSYSLEALLFIRWVSLIGDRGIGYALIPRWDDARLIVTATRSFLKRIVPMTAGRGNLAE